MNVAHSFTCQLSQNETVSPFIEDNLHFSVCYCYINVSYQNQGFFQEKYHLIQFSYRNYSYENFVTPYCLKESIVGVNLAKEHRHKICVNFLSTLIGGRTIVPESKYGYPLKTPK